MGKIAMSKENDKKDKWEEVLAKLIQLTQEKKLKWESLTEYPSMKLSDDDKITTVFTTYYKGKRLWIYRRRYKARFLKFGTTSWLPKPDDYEIRWTTNVYLEIIDDKYNPVWAFPSEDMLNDLLTTIQYQVSGVGDFMDEILDEK